MLSYLLLTIFGMLKPFSLQNANQYHYNSFFMLFKHFLVWYNGIKPLMQCVIETERVLVFKRFIFSICSADVYNS